MKRQDIVILADIFIGSTLVFLGIAFNLMSPIWFTPCCLIPFIGIGIIKNYYPNSKADKWLEQEINNN